MLPRAEAVNDGASVYDAGLLWRGTQAAPAASCPSKGRTEVSMSVPRTGKTSLTVALCALILSADPALTQDLDADARRSQAERLVTEFWHRVWIPQPDLTGHR